MKSRVRFSVAVEDNSVVGLFIPLALRLLQSSLDDPEERIPVRLPIGEALTKDYIQRKVAHFHSSKAFLVMNWLSSTNSSQ